MGSLAGSHSPIDAISDSGKANKIIVAGDVRFPKGELPPAEGFWSLPMFDSGYFFVNNPINRYSISARQNLKANPDGSADLYIQKDSPGADKEANWLPAPSGNFILMLRMYWPAESDPTIICISAFAPLLGDKRTSVGSIRPFAGTRPR